MSNHGAHHYRPVARWRWDPAPNSNELRFALDQAVRQELGGLVIDPHTVDRDALSEAIAAGAERGLMMWVALPPPASVVNALRPGAVAAWMANHWARLLLADGMPHAGLSGIVLPEACPPVPAAGEEWDEVFLEAFLDQKGYAPGAAHADHPHVRADVYDVYTSLLAAAWYGGVGEWCDEHNLNLIACIAGEKVPSAAALGKYTAEIDIPAIRFPIHRPNRDGCIAVHSASKLALRPRTAAILDHGPLSYYSLDRLKETTDVLVGSGIDLLIVDGFGGQLDAGMGLSYQIPQWPHVHLWARDAAVLCERAAHGRKETIAIFDPGLSIAAGPESIHVADAFAGLRAALDSDRLDYVLFDEANLERAVAVEKRLFVRGHRFDMLLVPPVTHLMEPSIAALRRLATEVRVVAFGAGQVEVLPPAGRFRLQTPRCVTLSEMRGIECCDELDGMVARPRRASPALHMDTVHVSSTMLLDSRWHFTPHGGNVFPIGQWPMEIHVAEPLANCRVLVRNAAPDTAVMLDGDLLASESSTEPRTMVFPIPGRIAAGTHLIDAQPAGEPARAFWAGDYTIQREDPPTFEPIRGIGTGGWETFGFSYFSGSATYVAECDIAAETIGTPCRLVLDGVCGTVEVEINGGTVEVLAWPPYRVDVTKWLRAGSNLITLTMSNTLANMLAGPDEAFPSGLVRAPHLEFGSWSRSECGV